jgi:aconitate hydratase/homoaconitate hydratase
MGKGSFAWLASAATVAASSQDMRITDPRPFLEQVDQGRFAAMLGRPSVPAADTSAQMQALRATVERPDGAAAAPAPAFALTGTIEGRVQRFGDHVDTDAIIPGEFCGITDWQELGRHCFAYVRPEFPARCAEGRSIVVAGDAWGTGSAREHAVWSLIGAGVRLVIARSFSVVHHRNLINEGVPTLVITDDSFFDLVKEDDRLSANVATGEVLHIATGRSFAGSTPDGIAAEILARGGITKMLLSASNED